MAAGFEYEPFAAAGDESRDHRRVVCERHRRLVAVANTQASAQIDMRKSDAVRGQVVDEFQHLPHGFAVRRQLGDLRANVDVESADNDVAETSGTSVQRSRIGEGDAEFALLQARGDVRMRQRIHVRIHAEADGCDQARAAGDRIETSELGGRLDVEAVDADVKRRSHFSFGLATPENTTLAGSPPAASTRASSPPDTMSKPLPSRAKSPSTARFGFAFIA